MATKGQRAVQVFRALADDPNLDVAVMRKFARAIYGTYVQGPDGPPADPATATDAQLADATIQVLRRFLLDVKAGYDAKVAAEAARQAAVDAATANDAPDLGTD